MADSDENGRLFKERRKFQITSIQQFQFGDYFVTKKSEPGVRLRFENASGRFNNKSSHTLTLGQLAGLVEIAATDIPEALRFRMIAVLAGAEFKAPHPLVLADAKRWVE